MKLLKIARVHAFIPYIKHNCFSKILEGFSQVTFKEKGKTDNTHNGQQVYKVKATFMQYTVLNIISSS